MNLTTSLKILSVALVIVAAGVGIGLRIMDRMSAVDAAQTDILQPAPPKWAESQSSQNQANSNPVARLTEQDVYLNGRMVTLPDYIVALGGASVEFPSPGR